jgi:hypothetical protein
VKQVRRGKIAQNNYGIARAALVQMFAGKPVKINNPDEEGNVCHQKG